MIYYAQSITQHYRALNSGDFLSLDEQKAAPLDLKQACFGEGLLYSLPLLHSYSITQHYWALTSGDFLSLDEQKAAPLDLKRACFGESLLYGLPLLHSYSPAQGLACSRSTQHLPLQLRSLERKCLNKVRQTEKKKTPRHTLILQIFI
jgi:hypothetical protein